jgi:cytoskeletal protein RodZ
MGIFGDTLRQAREDLGASIADAERETHIHRRYLEALEAEDESALPATVYTRGFIRTYSHYLGLNPEAMIDLFGPRIDLGERAELRPIPAQVGAPRPIALRPVVLLGMLVMAGLLTAYLWSQYNAFVESLGQVEQVPTSRGAASPTVSPKPTGSPTAPAVAASPSPSPPVVAASPVPTPTSGRGLLVEARIVERTWLEVWVDGRTAVAETMAPGTNRSFTAEQQVRMRVGNAAGVQVTVNGVSQGALGAPGQAVEAIWGRQ